MRKWSAILVSSLWLLALANMWLVVRAADEHARIAAERIRPSPWPDPPQSGHTLVIINAPPAFAISSAGPPMRKTAKPAPH